MNVLIIIPARGGSKGIPRKNVRLLNGKPLISYVIETSKKSKYSPEIFVTTDDDEIERVSVKYGANVVRRKQNISDDSTTLDPVIYDALTKIKDISKKKFDCIITIQPTSPLLSVPTLDLAIKTFIDNKYDTLLSVINSSHLAWRENNGKYYPAYTNRVNRQKLPKYLKETGAFVITKEEFITENSRFGKNISVLEVPLIESIDIDDSLDWVLAESILNRKNIVFRVEGYKEIGLGHIYRCLLLADNMINHNIIFMISDKSEIGIQKIKKSNYPFVIIKDNDHFLSAVKDYKADIIINDILDTTKEYVLACKDIVKKVINFEDLGNGTQYTDATINDLYEKKNNLSNHYWGSNYYCLRDEFILSKKYMFSEKVKNILIIFGGTDPNNYTQRVFNCLAEINEKDIKFTFILGTGYNHKLNIPEINISNSYEIIRDTQQISEYMLNADIAISSQGRTMLELASLSVPTILLAQNDRELHHEFGYLSNGFINLGLGYNIDNSSIVETIRWMIHSPQIRYQMHMQMKKTDLKKGIKRVLELILEEES